MVKMIEQLAWHKYPDEKPKLDSYINEAKDEDTNK